MKQSLLILFVFCNLIVWAQNKEAQNQVWKINSSVVQFKVKNAGFTVDGNFTGLNGKIIFDDAKNTGNYIEVSLDTKTINTGNSSRDNHLRKSEYFDIEKFPKIYMKSFLFTEEKNGTYTGQFKLTIKGITKDVKVPFSFTKMDTRGKFKASFEINRIDYKIGESSFILSDKVNVVIEVNVSIE